MSHYCDNFFKEERFARGPRVIVRFRVKVSPGETRRQEELRFTVGGCNGTLTVSCDFTRHCYELIYFLRDLRQRMADEVNTELAGLEV